ncbi:ribosome hibernation-promoting factor, HPF/YfiA family [Clostridium arbusti]|jgi:putative sigma-54 modulation protein|uniref:ribosome hibernation-promoting factor, HPF/YfiA family n=1 Tax=Clostridium arbusti TaxID=1137848 RepID=UPI0002896643|nr:ribosome-associated translation inhibitor RaiA [Clostridium arbusti]
MRITISGKNVEVTNGLRSAIEKKLTKLDRYFNPDVTAHATLSVENYRQIVEVTIPFGGAILRGEESNTDMYAAIDLVADKMERQVRKQKTKLDRKKYGASLRFQSIPDFEDYGKDEVKEPSIVKTKKFAIKPMSEEEAVLQMELLAHSFFVFQNADSTEVNVVYKRKDGNYGLIEPEF